MSSGRSIPVLSPQALKAPRHPLLWATLAYAAGIVAGSYAWRPASWWVVATIGFVAAGAYFIHRRRFYLDGTSVSPQLAALR